ncbi:hypothetical protein PENTCL1PPCAC_10898, partial [Pristionchus entomophagus]
HLAQRKKRIYQMTAFSLPDDCILEILSKLDVNDLESVKCVNRRMYLFSSYQIPRAIKKDAFELRILQSTVYHGFQLYE